MRARILLVGCIVGLMMPRGLLALGESSARGMGMAGTFVAVSRDLDAVGWNPANLALMPTGFRITEQTLEKLRSEGLPDDVLEKLEDLKDQRLIGREDLADTLKTTLGEEQAAEFESSILKQAETSERSFCLSPLSLGGMISNNAFSINMYNEYNGAELSDKDQQEILDAVPEDGLDLDAGVEARAFGFSYGSFAFRGAALASGRTVLPKTPIEILLFGNEFGRSYPLGDLDGEAWTVLSLSLSGAHPIHIESLKDYFDVLAIGGTLKVLRGFVYGDVVSSSGTIYTGQDRIDGNGEIVYRWAEGGTGFALDLGAAGTIRGGWTVGLAVIHAFGGVSWNTDTEEQRNSFAISSLNAKEISEAEDVENELVETEEVSRNPGTFSSDLPAVLRVGAAREWPKLLCAIDYEQGLATGPGVSTVPRFSTGVEYRALNWLKLRGGLSLGGQSPGINTAFGFGLGGRAFMFDLAIVNRGGILPGGSRGIGFALDTKIKWGARL